MATRRRLPATSLLGLMALLGLAGSAAIPRLVDLDGVWQVTYMVTHGVPDDPQLYRQAYVMITRNAYVLIEVCAEGVITENYTFVCFPPGKPVLMDTQRATARRGRLSRGLVRIEGDKMQWCSGPEGDPKRPVDLVSRPGSKAQYAEFRRVHAPPPPRPPEPEPLPDTDGPIARRSGPR